MSKDAAESVQKPYAEMTEEEKEAFREKGKWDNYVPPEKRKPTRPPDEFFDLKTLKTDSIRVEVISP